MFIRGKSAIYYRICISSAFLIVCGTVFLLSSSVSYGISEGGNPLLYLYERIIWIILSVFLLYVLKKIGIEKIEKISFLIFIFSLALLTIPVMLNLIYHKPEYLRWIKIGPLSFQPSELVKLTFIIFLANYLNMRDKMINNWKVLLFPVLFFLFIIIILQFQKDMGTVVIMGATFFFLLFLAGLKMKYITIFSILGVILIAGLILLFPYRIERIKNFLNPTSDPKGGGYQIIQSRITLGSGGVFGKGLGRGEGKLSFLPVVNKDYIYAVVGEEKGFIGTSFILILFAILVFSSFEVSTLAKNNFDKYLSAGIGTLFGFQFLLHALVVISIIPSKGTTLPFFSKGGSSFVINFLTLGILIIIAKRVCIKGDLDDFLDF
ncbi:MAG TPA: putative peptidoglycan glycosyltransferase FtsW [bacterium]|nr:putative peptidoglycan glycosyltransferase FtsW [bacterium]